MTEQPLEIERKTELKLFIFTVPLETPTTISVDPPCHFHSVLGYEYGEAMQQVRMHYPPGQSILIKGHGAVPVKTILEKVKAREMKLPEVAPVEVAPAPEKVKKTKQEFVQGLMLVADEFVTDKADQETLKGIISRVQI